MVGVVGAESLPSDVPAFLRTPEAVAAIGEYAREPDRWKGSGKIHDTDRDAAHFLDVDDEGKMYGGPKFTVETLPPTRADYEKALAAAGHDSWNAGYLPYSIIDGYQQLVKDFTYWRILQAAVQDREGQDQAEGLLRRRPEASRGAAGPRPGRLGPLCRRRQPAAASERALQRLGRLPQSERLHPEQGHPRRVRGAAGQGRGRRGRRQGAGAGLQGLRLLDRRRGRSAI
jgi:hypothetical protein